METIIYHINYTIVKYPNIIVGKNTKDFDHGFYCTRVKQQAEKLANKYKTPVINSYELADISDLKVKIFKEYNEEWLDFIVHCRNGGEHDYDVVEGFMCDDTILDNLEEYISGYIDKSTFLDMMKFNWNNNQISFHTVKALKRIKFISSEKIEK
ncbi:DUF3990 domain-containing protein [uncultured Clostridium sp.]|uniref:DUF3990 domain-containing protein n=1 Tax=uncultured Clostridium sp. TaxID=59620 RepID=UPI0034A05B82